MAQKDDDVKEGSAGLYEDPGWKGGYVHIEGPCKLMSLESTKFEKTKKEKVSERSRSLKTGPNTWLLAPAEDCASSGCDEKRLTGDRLYVGPNEAIRDLNDLDMGNMIQSLQLWTSRSQPELPSFRFGEGSPCFVWLTRQKSALEGGLLFEDPVEISSLDWYRLYGPTKRQPSIALKTGPSAWVEIFPEEGLRGEPLYFEPDTVVRDLSAYYPDGQKPWFKSLRLWKEEPAHWPGASLPPPSSRDRDKVVRTALLNHNIRGGVLGAVKAAPGLLGAPAGVGGGLGFLLGALWPDPVTPMKVWDALYNAMEALIDKLIEAANRAILDDGLKVVYTYLQDYQRFSYGNAAKSAELDNLIGYLRQLQTKFANPKSPQTTLPYFVPLASIALVARHERLISYEAIYEGKTLTPEVREELLKDLKDLLDDFELVAKDGRKNAIQWRTDQIEIKKVPSTGNSVVADGYDSWTSPAYDTKSPVLQTILDQRKKRIKNEYGADLDDSLNTAYLWPYLIPTDANPKPKEKRLEVSSGPFGGPLKEGRKEFLDNSQDQPITRIRIWGGNRVDGIEVFYGGASAGRRGGDGGTRRVDYTFQKDEFIVGAFGWDGDSMNQVVFRTNLGRELGVGSGEGSSSAWVAWGPHRDARLKSISGIQSSAALESLTLVWEYTRFE